MVLKCIRWGCASLFIFVLVLLLTNCTCAIGPEDVVGDWTVSVTRSGAIQLARLEIREDSGSLRALLTSELGDVKIDDVKTEAEAFLLGYDVAIGDGVERVNVALRTSAGDLVGTVSTGRDDVALRWPIQAAKVGAPSESALLAKYASQQSPVPSGVMRTATNDAADFLGKWELTVGRVDIKDAPRRKIGVVIVDAGGKVAAGIKLKDDDHQRTIYHVTKIDRGLRFSYGMNLGVTIPFDIDLVRSGEGVNVTFTPPGQPTFLSGTAVKVDSGDQFGLDADMVAQKPGVELIGMISDNARVVAVQEPIVYIQEGTLLTALNVNDPLLVRFERARLPEKSLMVSLAGSKLSAVDRESSSLVVYDISDPTTTAPIGSCAFPMKLMMQYGAGGTKVFAVSRNGGSYQINVIDTSDPLKPILVRSSQPQKRGSVYDVRAAQPYLFIAGKQLDIFDVTQPQSLKLVSSFEGGGIGAMRGFDVVGSMAYIARSMHSGASYLRLVDISDPRAPVEVGSCRTSGGAQDVAVSGAVAFVADRAYGLVLIDVSDPTNLRQCGFFRISGLSTGVTVAGPLVFLKVMDLMGRKDKLAVFRHAR